MWLLWLLGQQLEPEMGSPRFAGALLRLAARGARPARSLVDPLAVTVGASGAIFGLMGAFAAIRYSRGINPFKTGIGGLIVLNLVISFAVSNISWSAATSAG